MSLADDFVAVVFRRKLLLYQIMKAGEVILMQTYQFGFSVPLASIVPLSPSNTPGSSHFCSHTETGPIFVLALGNRSGFRVYHAQSRRREKLPLVWLCRYLYNSAATPYQPQLGGGGTSISWITRPTYSYGQLSSFCFARLPSSASDGQCRYVEPISPEYPQPGFYELQHESLPALYWKVSFSFDVDEVRGVAVLGNAFGEVVVCDFCHSPREILSSCFRDVHVPLLRHEDLLPIVRG